MSVSRCDLLLDAPVGSDRAGKASAQAACGRVFSRRRHTLPNARVDGAAELTALSAQRRHIGTIGVDTTGGTADVSDRPTEGRRIRACTRGTARGSACAEPGCTECRSDDARPAYRAPHATGDACRRAGCRRTEAACPNNCSARATARPTHPSCALGPISPITPHNAIGKMR